MPHLGSTTKLAALAAVLLTAGLLSCQDHGAPGPDDVEPRLVAVRYDCGRRFDLENGNTAPITVRYEVVGAGESGELTLSAATSTQPSRTRLVTLSAGVVRLAYQGTRIGEAANIGTACPPVAAEPQAAVGEWSAPFWWPSVAVHLHLLPTGKVLFWGRGETTFPPTIWDPVAWSFTEVTTPGTDVFCGGHSFLPDGRLLVAGGHIGDFLGVPDANVFDPGTERWSRAATMTYARWYPTNTTLPDGRVLTMGGTDEHGVNVLVPEIWDGTRWGTLPGMARNLPYYPRNFVAPNGRVFYAGELPQTGYFDVTGGGSWTPVATSRQRRDYGSAVMYEPGKVLIVGGSDPADGPPTNTAETIDLTAAAPQWRTTGAMAYARRHLNATLLPDGTVVATGGTSAGGFSDTTGAVHAAELWDPKTGMWTTLASNRITRVYHSTTILLPDGKLLHSGSGDGAGLRRELNAELFAPPYLFKGPRPTVTSAPSTVHYGERFVVATPDAGVVTRVSWIRLPSVTHAFDENQRFNALAFTRTAGGITAVAPSGPNLAPPGHYMLFLLTDDGVPSIARILKID